jgi:hypothetical protein
MSKTQPFIRDYCKAKYKTAKGNWDIYCVFCERAISLMKENGKFGYIIPNKFLSAPPGSYGIYLKEFLSNYQINYLADYSSIPVFISRGKKVNIYPIVIIIEKKIPDKKGVYLKMEQKNENIQCIFQKEFQILPGEINWTQKFDLLEELLSAIEKKSVKILKHFSVESPAFISDAY